MVVGGVGLVPESTPARSCGAPTRPTRCPGSTSGRRAIELRTTLVEVTRRLVDLDVASWQPEIPDLLMNLRHRPRLPLPPRHDARRVETVDRAVLCLEIVALALRATAARCRRTRCAQRRAALGDLDRAARRALVGACSGRTG